MADPDFLAIVSLANLGREIVPAGGPAPGQAPAVTPPASPRREAALVLQHTASDGGSPELVGDQDLDMLAVLAAERPQLQHRHRQRSWQHAEGARHGKALKKARHDLEAERSQRIVAHQTTGVLATMLGQAFPCRDSRRLMTPELSAVAKLSVACMPPRKSSGSSHARAAAQLASCIDQVQKERLESFFMHGGLPPPTQHGGAAQSSRSDPRGGELQRTHILMFCFQWDETSQSLRAALPKNRLLARAPGGQVSVQTMMAYATMHVHVNSDIGRLTLNAPYFLKGVILDEQKTQHILEALLRRLPIPFDRPGEIESKVLHCDALVLAWCMDRATVNFCVSRYLADQIGRMPPKVLGHCEPCAAHGLALVKGRGTFGQKIAGAANSLSKLLRTAGFAGALRDALAQVVSDELIVKREPRPPMFQERAERFFQTLFGGDGDAYLRKRSRRGASKESQLYRDIKALMAVVDVGSGELVHWCWSESEGHAEGSAAGPCCGTREECVERVLIPLMNFLLQASWEVAALSRWTHVGKLVKRALVGCMCCKLLPKALNRVKVCWGTPESESLATALGQLIALDQKDWKVKQKVKLLRICQAFCADTAAQDLSLVLLTIMAVDRALYAIIGHDRERASLADMCDLRESPLLSCADHLCKLLSEWGSGAQLWDILALSGADFSSARLRCTARCQILRMFTGLHDYFFTRMRKPPYSLTPLCDARLPELARRGLAESFLAEPIDCLPPFCARLRALCPTIEGMLSAGVEILRCWGSHAMVAIDACERSHAQFRQCVSSTGPGRSAVPVANRVLCAQAHAAHVALGGDAMHTSGRKLKALLGVALGLVETDTVPKQRSLHPGSPFIRFLNCKMKTFKRLHSPNKALDEKQRQWVQEVARQEWVQMGLRGDGEQEQWCAANRAAKARPTLEQTPAQEEPEPFVGLWGRSQHRQLLLDLPTLVRCQVGQLGSGVSAWQDETMYVRPDAPIRCRDAGIIAHSCGCFAPPKNVCRVHQVHPEQLLDSLEQVAALLSKWVQSIGKDRARSCAALIWLTPGSQPSSSSSSSPSEPPPAGVLALLVDATYRPKAQSFVKCHVVGTPPSATRFTLPQFPFMARLALGPTLPGASCTSVEIKSSDDLALELAQESHSWTLTEMRWEMPTDTHDLLSMRILGRGVAFDYAAAVEKQQRKIWQLPKELFLGDPLQMPLPPGVCAGGDDSGDAVLDDAGVDGDSVSDISSDIADLQEDLLGHGAPSENEWVGDGGGGDGGEDEDGDVERDLLFVVEAAVEEEPPATPTVAEAIAASTLSPAGYIVCSIEPWRSIPSLGRITTWPADRALEQRSSSTRCYLHPRCSVAKKRSDVTDDFYLRWLYSGTVLESDATPERKKECAAEHMALFKQMFAAESLQAAANQVSTNNS